MPETESTARLPSVKRIIRWMPEFLAECRTAPSGPFRTMRQPCNNGRQRLLIPLCKATCSNSLSAMPTSSSGSTRSARTTSSGRKSRSKPRPPGSFGFRTPPPLKIPASVLKAAGQYTLSLWLHDQVGHHPEDGFRSDVQHAPRPFQQEEHQSRAVSHAAARMFATASAMRCGAVGRSYIRWRYACRFGLSSSRPSSFAQSIR